MKAWKVIFAALLLFGSGAATGAALSRLWAQATVRAEAAVRAEATKRGPLPPMAWQRYEFLRRAQRDLKLSEEQKTRIDSLMKESQDRFRKLWEPVAPVVRAEFEALREKIRGELTAEQQLNFDELLKKSERERRRFREGGGTNEPPHEKKREGVVN